jgi:hypothetical protein
MSVKAYSSVQFGRLVSGVLLAFALGSCEEAEDSLDGDWEFEFWPESMDCHICGDWALWPHGLTEGCRVSAWGPGADGTSYTAGVIRSIVNIDEGRFNDLVTQDGYRIRFEGSVFDTTIEGSAVLGVNACSSASSDAVEFTASLINDEKYLGTWEAASHLVTRAEHPDAFRGEFVASRYFT